VELSCGGPVARPIFTHICTVVPLIPSSPPSRPQREHLQSVRQGAAALAGVSGSALPTTHTTYDALRRPCDHPLERHLRWCRPPPISMCGPCLCVTSQGRTVYYGPTSRVVDYFERAGYTVRTHATRTSIPSVWSLVDHLSMLLTAHVCTALWWRFACASRRGRACVVPWSSALVLHLLACTGAAVHQRGGLAAGHHHRGELTGERYSGLRGRCDWVYP
jgi:hypothetical protein